MKHNAETENLLAVIEARLSELGIKEAELDRRSGHRDFVKNLRAAVKTGRPYHPKIDTLRAVAKGLKMPADALVSTNSALTAHNQPDDMVKELLAERLYSALEGTLLAVGRSEAEVRGLRKACEAAVDMQLNAPSLIHEADIRREIARVLSVQFLEASKREES